MNNILQFNKINGDSKIVHGFSTRHYGDMATKNPSSKVNMKNFLMDLDIDPLNTVNMEQVHGENVEWVNAENAGWRILQTDGLITETRNVFLIVRCADCFPVFITDSSRQIVCTIHAGRRGVYNEIIIKAIESLGKKGFAASDLSVFIGPGIRSCCYKISKEIKSEFAQKFNNISKVIIENGENYHLSLPDVIKAQVIGCKVSEENIEDMNICTYENNNLYSYRRDGEMSGRFVGVIGLI